MNIDILEVMKHRYPFLMVDKVIQCEYLKSAKVIKNVTYNEPWVPGHYPNKPIFPGVMLIEAMGQASGVMLMDFSLDEVPNKYGYLVKVEQCKFIRSVYPGDQIFIDCQFIEQIGDAYIVAESVAKVNGKKVAKARLIFMLKEGKNE